MENSFYKEVILALEKYLKQYAEWLKPTRGEPLGLVVVKSIFKAFSTIFLLVFSPVVLLILVVAFLAAF
jgi:hypothetical protein